MTDRAARLGIAGLSVAGIAIAGYLSWARAAGETVACPVAGGGCETVQQSSYSELVGIPVAYLGLATYVVLLILALWDAEEAKVALAALALSGTAFAAYLLVVMAFVIDAVCVWCLGSDVVIATIALLSVWRLRLAPTPSEPGAAPSARSGRGSPPGSRRSP